MNLIISRLFKSLLFTVLVLSQLQAPVRAADQDGTLVFGFLPILSTQKLVTRFNPLVDHLSEAIDQPIRMETAPDYAEFLRRTKEKRYDIVFTAPHFYYLANKESGYKVLVRVNATDLKAIIVATRVSGISRLSQLRGKRIATPDPLSLGAALIRDTLRKAGLDPDKDLTIVSTPSHNAALLTAFNGVTEAAGLMIPPYERASVAVHNQMVTLGTTVGTPHMPIAVSPSVAPDLAEKIAESLVSLSNTETGRLMFKRLAWPTGLIRATNSEYAPLKDIATEMHVE
jgi:phosphonate transport system substrate-binding protein